MKPENVLLEEAFSSITIMMIKTSSSYEGILIGGGIIGLATVNALLHLFPNRKFLVLEKEPELATHQTGHNSGVIHSGIYYRPASLKAKLCREGAESLITFCKKHGIPHEVCGKVIVATRASQLPALEALYERGGANGVKGLSFIGPERLREIEPHVRGLKALHVPGTAIVDFRQVATTYAKLAREKGVDIQTSAPVEELSFRNSEWIVKTLRGDFRSRVLINCAGLFADRIAILSGMRPDVAIIPFRGEYYELRPDRTHLVKGLVYPVPDPLFPFLGVHLTRMISGKVEAGPNAVLAFKREGYRKRDVSAKDLWGMFSYAGFWKMTARYMGTGLKEFFQSLSKKAFVEGVRQFVPELTSQDFLPGKSGVRAQAVDKNGLLVDDFSIFLTQNAVHVLNVPSPAATASLSIADYIAEKAKALFH